MRICKAFRFRAYPTIEQIATLGRWIGALRFLWNLALSQWQIGQARAREDRRYPSAFDQINQLTALRAELPWLAEVPRNVCAQLLVTLNLAWQRCFKGFAERPNWKRKGKDFVNFCEPHPKMWRLNGDILTFPKLGNVRLVVHRPLEGTAKTCTLSRDGDQWFVSIVCEIEIPDPQPRLEPKVAIDRGIVNLAATSDGALIPGPQRLKASLKKLARQQRKLARKQKGSKNQAKQETRVMKVHRTIRRQRHHDLHVLSSRYAKSHGVIVMEDLNVAGMIRGNSSRGISDSGWGTLQRFCQYKLDWTGGLLQLVPAAYSSQECSQCGHVDAKSRRSQAVFCCTKCGHTDHADINAAKVLLRRANYAALPVEGMLLEGSLRSRKVKKGLRVPRRSTSPKPQPFG